MIETWRPLLETCAYNILGSREEAKDVVQDVFLNVLDKPIEHIENKKSYLMRAVINRAINAHRHNELSRRSYRGTWLPEPVMTRPADHQFIQKELLSYSMMVLLEKLTARERAVFILREGFEYTHNEISEAIGISPASSRQLLRRARNRLKAPAINPAIGPAPNQRNLPPKEGSAFRPDQFLSLIQNRETAQLENLLSEDIVITSDGGGKVLANRIPVRGRSKAIKYLLSVYENYQKNNRFVPAIVNHQQAFLQFRDRELVTCQVFQANESSVEAIFFVRNPDKLRHILDELSVI